MIFETRYHRDAEASSEPLTFRTERDAKALMLDRIEHRHATPDVYADCQEDGDLVPRVDASSTNENALKAQMAARMSARSSK